MVSSNVTKIVHHMIIQVCPPIDNGKKPMALFSSLKNSLTWEIYCIVILIWEVTYVSMMLTD